MQNYQAQNNFTFTNMESVSPIDKKLSILIYIAGFFTWIFGPIILVLLFGKESAYFRKRSKEFFNFQVSYSIYLTILLFFSSEIPPIILIVMLLSLVMHVFYIIGAIKMMNGKKYIAPLSIKLFK